MNKLVAMPVSSKLLPYAGSWDMQKAAHLLKRCTFGPKYQEIKHVQSLGLKAAVEELLKDIDLPFPPVNAFDETDIVPIGEVWVDQPMPQSARFRRRKSLFTWSVKIMAESGINIREKMTLFWHNHFAIEAGVVNDARYLYRYITLLRENALGNFKELVKAVTIDPTMLRYLNGRQNTKNRPNENYARELLELFTIGKGPIAGPGDYTNYTEEDVVAISKILTGWRDLGYNSDKVGSPSVEFRSNQHDTSVKQLSHRFNSFLITNSDEEEYKKLIDIIFTQVEVAYFICRKLYRWFLNYEVTEAIEKEIIQPLGALLIQNNFEVKAVIRTLLLSEHFYEEQFCGGLIKNPMDYSVGLLRQSEVVISDELVPQYNAYWKVYQLLGDTQMAYFAPPAVAGWPAYYQEPIFYQSWINTATLSPRNDFSEGITSSRGWKNVRLKVDVLGLIATLDNPEDPNLLIEELGLLFYPVPLVENQTAFLKEMLIPGLPDFEWTVEYGKYLGDPSDENLKMSVEQRLLDLLRAMFNMPEVHLS